MPNLWKDDLGGLRQSHRSGEDLGSGGPVVCGDAHGRGEVSGEGGERRLLREISPVTSQCRSTPAGGDRCETAARRDKAAAGVVDDEGGQPGDQG
jgi:hypothetical protein